MLETAALPLALMPRIPFGEKVAEAVDWVTEHWGVFFDSLNTHVNNLVDDLSAFLLDLPIVVVVVVLALLAFLVKGWKLGVVSAVGLLLIDSFNCWPSTMETLSLILVAAVIAILIAVPVGVLAAKSSIASAIIRPIMDFMQTLPAFVYLLPVLFLFGIGSTAAITATIVFAIPPGVRLTELGIRQVDPEMVEAGQSFGASPSKILFGVELPLALPSIMAGINQVIMLALSMVVIGGMVGAAGLGADVTAALQNLDIARGAEAGVSVVILAIYLDRVTAALGDLGRSPLGVFRTRRRAAKLAVS